MSDIAIWPTAAPLTTPRLHLEPLRVEHAREAVSVFDDERLHTWTGGTPCTLEELEAKYLRQSAGQSPDGSHGWLNWMLRRLTDGQLVGTVQATLYHPAPGRTEAELAWVIGVDHQGNGYGRESARAMADWLGTHGVDGLTAHIHPGHKASIGIARALGLSETDEMTDGEILWRSTDR
ncbi:GNAT family N-acetyltransferase [Actinacidiphila acididurans]|uniref:GNAT family N-acetyltransferase n=1 Tax=Actinacidiphila acididurans TaxID=2784346 RepID=A0ABS2TLK7_9ACTN|nr:GNAT family N-acetyltransferase [Actinacidiphila acididurans]MBM9504223.1 GNAT family N-acetyltransferase [Actinacidiphila acididurans]